jgi:hypothetical protein
MSVAYAKTTEYNDYGVTNKQKAFVLMFFYEEMKESSIFNKDLFQ